MGVMEACCARVLTHLARAVSTTVPSPLTCAPSDALVESSPVHLGARKASAKRSDGRAHIVQQCGVQSVLHEDEACGTGVMQLGIGATHQRSAACRSPLGPPGLTSGQGRREAFPLVRTDVGQPFLVDLRSLFLMFSMSL
jgi:hypothetical protein